MALLLNLPDFLVDVLENHRGCFSCLISASQRRLEWFENFCAKQNVAFLWFTEPMQNLMVSLSRLLLTYR